MALRAFFRNETFRNGQPSLVAVDIINLTDALKIDNATSLVSKGIRQIAVAAKR
jgi:hypothetical protein